jgi:capsular polysaccharide export protein
MIFRVFLAPSRGLRRLRHLPTLLGGPVVRNPCPGAVAVLAWGRKQSALTALETARRLGLPCWSIEDGFIRSIGLGVLGAAPFGFICDRSGIFYDASGPSDLESLIASDAVLPHEVAALRQRLVSLQACKYNHTWAQPPSGAAGRARRILLVDQTRGDASVRLGGGSAEAFATMLATAHADAAGAELWVKIHPDVIARRRRGYLAELDLAGCNIISEDVNPIALVRWVDAVYTVTSQLGFEALLAGVPVRCFGLPFYAGWGLTADAQTCPRRGVERSLDHIFWAAYGVYTQYADPVTGERCDLARILDRIADHRRAVHDAGRRCWVFGVTLRKRLFMGNWLLNNRLSYVSTAWGARLRGAQAGDRVVTWSFRRDAAARQLAGYLGTTVERMEDGFIRSVGLGSDWIQPRSLVLDRSGIYFDPRQPSDLETILATHPFSAQERLRGQALVTLLQAVGVTKYNTGQMRPPDLALAGSRRRILVPGQVEDDQSIRCGTTCIRTNAALLAEVRRRNPEDFIIFKPHPDVLVGNRRGAVPPEVLGLADLVVTDCDMATCLGVVDAVHTMTSLTGFEALIHGRQVTTYGLPFYAGWGLTTDAESCPRRTRQLTLVELVHGVLVLYPRYWHPSLRMFVGPETVIAEVAAARRERAAHLGPRGLLRRVAVWANNFARGR